MKKKFIFTILFSVVILAVLFQPNSFNLDKNIKDESKSKNLNKTEFVNDNGIFSKYYKLSEKKLKTMSLDEKISQILLVRYSEVKQKEILKEYQFGGYIFFARDFKDKTKEEVITEIKSLQKVSKIPLITAVDEEGGIVVRVSSNPNIRSERFLSPRKLYDIGGLDKIKEDANEKNRLLNELGLNLNLAPVVDIAEDEEDYMYSRSLGQNKEVTGEFAKIIIETSKNSGVSSCLKHFPGYGNNADTHNGISVDTRTYEDIMNNDIYPFKEGIKAGAEAVLISHNIVNSIDKENPASLSLGIHKLLRSDLGFTGIIITDDLDMGAITNIDDSSVKAVLAGNDIIITTDYEESINTIKNAIENKTIKEVDLNKAVLRVLSWKYYKGLM